MDPIVISSALQRLSRVKRPVQLFLPLSVELCGFSSLLDLQPLPLTVFVGHLLLVVRKLGLLDEVVFRVLHGAQNAFVLLPRMSVSSRKTSRLSHLQ
jgi:hypothetical protein